MSGIIHFAIYMGHNDDYCSFLLSRCLIPPGCIQELFKIFLLNNVKIEDRMYWNRYGLYLHVKWVKMFLGSPFYPRWKYLVTMQPQQQYVN